MKEPKKNQTRTLKNLEVGTVYRHPRGQHLFLAVSPQLLVGYVKGKRREIIRSSKWEIHRTCSVNELLDCWNVSVATLDEISSSYLDPPQQKSGNRQHNKIS